jgi:hypothetical protein
MGSPHDRLVLAAAGISKDPDKLLDYMQRKGYKMSPELRAELEAKHRARMAAAEKASKPKKTRKKAKKRRKANAKGKKSSAGIRTMKELDIALMMRKHGKPSVKVTKVRY